MLSMLKVFLPAACSTASNARGLLLLLQPPPLLTETEGGGR
jgi:hypothetical protein